MRGRRRTIAAALADVLARTPHAGKAALAAAFADACGPRIAREASFRGELAGVVERLEEKRFYFEQALTPPFQVAITPGDIEASRSSRSRRI